MTICTQNGSGLGLLAAILAALAGGTVAHARTPAGSALPTGDDRAFRERMMEWHSKPAPKPTIIERETQFTPPAMLRISSPFGWRHDPITGTRRHHAGVDLPSPSGANVFATGAGRVVSAGWVAGYGKRIEVEHPGGVRTRYGHLSRILVGRGSAVAQGQVIGSVGSTGRSTGPHLHYEVRVNGVPANPLKFLAHTVPRYETLWTMEPKVEPRWAGWANPAGQGLPHSIIE